MNRLRSRTARYLIASILVLSLVPWVGGAWSDALRGPSTEARAAWLHSRVASWPSDAARDAFQRALAETEAQAWTTPEQFTAHVLQAYEQHAPNGHTAARLLGHAADADIATLAYWLHHQDSQWGGTAPVPRVQSAALAALPTARAAFGAAALLPQRAMLAHWTPVEAVAPCAATGRWLIRCLLQAVPRAP